MMRHLALCFTLLAIFLTTSVQAKRRVNAETNTDAAAATESPSSALETRWGFLAGLSLASVGINLDFPILGTVTLSVSKTGFAGGGFMEIPFHRLFAFEPELLFLQKGGSYNQGSTTLSFKYDVIEMPLLVKVTGIQKQLRGSLFFGPSVAFAIGNSWTSSDSSTVDQLGNSAKAFDIGLHFGGAVEYEISPRLRALLNIRYIQGLLNIANGSYSYKVSSTLFLTGLNLAF